MALAQVGSFCPARNGGGTVFVGVWDLTRTDKAAAHNPQGRGVERSITGFSRACGEGRGAPDYLNIKPEAVHVQSYRDTATVTFHLFATKTLPGAR